MDTIPHSLIDLAYVAVVAFLGYLGLQLKNILLKNKIELMEAINATSKEQGEKVDYLKIQQNQLQSSLTTHVATDELEFKQITRRLDHIDAKLDD